jgi:succinate dehydrogenase / fumarate reductase iron-sulfur subunit
MQRYEAGDVNPDMSFLEMLDVVNEGLIAGRRRTRSPSSTIAARASADVRLHDQRHRARPAARPPPSASFTCATSKTGDELYLEPWRAKAFPVIKDLIVDRSAFDRIIEAGGYIRATGSAPDGNTIPVPKEDADLAMDAAACIGCGACVAACPNASAALFTAAKISHLGAAAARPARARSAQPRAMESRRLRKLHQHGGGVQSMGVIAELFRSWRR